MALLRFLNLLIFGPKVTLSARNFGLRPVRQSWRLLVVNAGSSSGEENELRALENAYYDFERFGFSFVSSPRQADVLLVVGPVTRNMAESVKLAYAAAPAPCVVVAVGDGACTGGLWRDTYAVVGPVEAVIPVDIHIPGDIPTPTVILQTLLTALTALRP